MIDEPDGPSSGAVCKNCGGHKDFLNAFKRQQRAWPLPGAGPVTPLVTPLLTPLVTTLIANTFHHRRPE
jgi:hypothetical protein